jgi:hypothetical protein
MKYPMFLKEAAWKRQILGLSTALLFFACNKTPNSLQNDHDLADSLLSGSYIGLTIGDSSRISYDRLQQLYISDSIDNLTIVDNMFSNPMVLPYLLPLYLNIYTDDTIGSDYGLELAFKSDTLQFLIQSHGIILSSWPSSTRPESTITIGNHRAEIANKLVELSGSQAYKKSLRAFRLFEKDLSSLADTFLLCRPQWYFSRRFSTDTVLQTQLFFQNKKLIKVKNVKYAIYPCCP